MQILTPDINSIKDIQLPKATREPFGEDVMHFINALSKKLRKEPKYREFEELVALGFWLRSSNILKLKEDFSSKYEKSIVFPRGIVFHIAPSNVDTIFLYSFVLSLLVGNHNIVRITQNYTPQIEPLLDLVVHELKNYKELYTSTILIRYGHEDEITQELSKHCDVRVIWGGDRTINHIRTFPIKPTAIELTFADKFSFLALNLNNIKLDDSFFEKLYRDSFTFMQNACSSVKALCFIDATQEQKSTFWKSFKEYVANKAPQLEGKNQIDKLIALSSLAIEKKRELSFDTYVSYITLGNLSEIDEQKHCGGGLFYDVDIKNLDELFTYSTKRHQTLSLAGISKKELQEIFKTTNPQGFDRVVSLGKAMEFNATWDGFEIMSSLCRVVDVDI